MTHKKLVSNNFNKSPFPSESVLDPLQDNKSASKTKRLSLKKASFKINSNVLDSLDRYHLQLQPSKLHLNQFMVSEKLKLVCPIIISSKKSKLHTEAWRLRSVVRWHRLTCFVVVAHRSNESD